MADDTIKRLEARVTELENKLSQAGQAAPDFSPEEMAAFQKVSDSLSGGAAAGCNVCSTGCISECKPCVIKACRTCIKICWQGPCINECICGPCNICGHGGPFGGGGFGGFGL
jgi:hypothetical protein